MNYSVSVCSVTPYTPTRPYQASDFASHPDRQIVHREPAQELRRKFSRISQVPMSLRVLHRRAPRP